MNTQTPRKRTNLNKRVPITALKRLAQFFKGNPHRYTIAEMAEKAEMNARTVRVLVLVNDRRPDLVKEVFADRISLFQAAEQMRADPSKWKTKLQTRL